MAIFHIHLTDLSSLERNLHSHWSTPAISFKLLNKFLQ